MLYELGIVSGKNTKVAQIFEGLFPGKTFMDVSYLQPSEYVSKYWTAYELYKTKYKTSNNTNGKLFEYILATLCIREKIVPFYMSAHVSFVPNVSYDLMFFTKETGPICWSAKTSLRERYKQADLEAIALKYVHRKSLSYLITLDKTEAKGVKEKIITGDVIGLDDVIIANTSEFDDLITDLKSRSFTDPPTIKVIEASQFVTENKVKKIFPSYP